MLISEQNVSYNSEEHIEGSKIQKRMSNAGGIGDFQSNSMVQIFEKNMRDIELRISRTKTNQ